MSDPSVINLRQARKARARNEAKARGDANAAKFGHSKAERSLQARLEAKASQRLDGLKLERKPE